MHKHPIESRINLTCQDCKSSFEAKRRDTLRCLACRKIAKAQQTRASQDRNREKINVRARVYNRKRWQKRRDAVNEWKRERYATDEEYRELRRAGARTWYALNGQCSDSIERRRTTSRAYYAKNKIEVNRRAVERNKARWARKGACEHCGLDDPRILIVHHKLPLHLGGTNDPSNLETLCRNCHAVTHFEMDSSSLQGGGVE